MASLAQKKLPLSLKAQDLVQKMICMDSSKGYRLYVKTGWDKKIAWDSGWIEKSGKIYAFSLTMDAPEEKYLRKRRALTLKALKIFRIL